MSPLASPWKSGVAGDCDGVTSKVTVFAAQGDGFRDQDDTFGQQGDGFSTQGDTFRAQGGVFLLDCVESVNRPTPQLRGQAGLRARGAAPIFMARRALTTNMRNAAR